VSKALKLYPWTFFFLSLSIHHDQQPRSGDHQMYPGGSVVGKASAINIEISPTPFLIFTGGVKSAKFGVVFNITRESLNFERFAFEKAARYPNSETTMQCCNYRPMSSPSLVKLGPRTPEKALSFVPHTPSPKNWTVYFRNFVCFLVVLELQRDFAYSACAYMTIYGCSLCN